MQYIIFEQNLPQQQPEMVKLCRDLYAEENLRQTGLNESGSHSVATM